MKDPLLSVIVPIYNTEKHLRRCLDSLLLQDIKDKIEILAINDASQDNCLIILKEYKDKYPNIIRITDFKTNQGVGVVRYVASKLSKGKYIGFVDSDDYLKSPQYFSHILKCLEEEEADIAITGYSISFKEITGDSYLQEEKGLINIEDELKVFSSSQEIMNVAYSTRPFSCIKVFKRDLYLKSFFDTNVPSRKSEDIAVLPIILFAKKVIYISSFDYVYEKRENSLCDYTNLENSHNFLEFKQDCINWSNYLLYKLSLINENEKPVNLDLFVKDLVISQIFSGFNPNYILKFSPEKEQRKIIKEIFSFMKLNKIRVKDLFYSDLRIQNKKFYQHFLIFLARLFSIFHYIFPIYTYLFLSFVRSAINGRVSKNKIKKEIQKRLPIIIDFYYSYAILKIKNSLFFRKIFLKKDKRKEVPVIVSLATYPGGGRHNTVYLVIESLLSQSVKPKKIFLWLYEGEFPNKLKDLPSKLINLQNDIFEICWSKKDIKSYNKIINTLEKYPNEIIVTADDDIIYQREWLENLWDSYQEDPQYVHVHRASKFYKSSDKWFSEGGRVNFYKEPSFINKITGGPGVLFPVGFFYKDILKEDLFKSLAPTNDDLWLWAMVVLNNKKIKRIEKCISRLNTIPNTQEVSLFHINDFGNQLYWVHFNNLIIKYPEFKEKLEEEWLLFKNNI